MLDDLGPTINSSLPAAPRTETAKVQGEVQGEFRGGVVLGRGHVIDLPGHVSRLDLAASWTSPDNAGWEIDVVALALTNDTVDREEDLVFYNQPSTPDGSVRLTVDGDSEQGVDVDLEALDDETARVRIAAAIDAEVTFGDVGAIRLSLADGDTGTEIASATLDAATDERTLVIVDIYRRRDNWRIRAVGQGYDYGLPTT